MFKILVATILIFTFSGQPGEAAARLAAGSTYLPLELAAGTTAYPIHQAEAAMIAKSANPGSTVLSVKLLPSGLYAVTLKVGGSVREVMVDATTGAIT